jgi:hypothetical protein
MPSVAHEVLVQVLHEDGVLAEVLRRTHGLKVGVVVPSDPNLSKVKPTEWHGDAFFVGGDPQSPERWLILEAQTSVDKEKLRTIPLSLELARDRYRGVPGDVVLVTAGAQVARWFDRHPFSYEGPLGTKRTLSVIRVNLTRVPVAKLLDARRPSLALLAVAAHAKGARPKARRVASRALEVARKSRGAVASGMVDAILQLVDAKLRRELEEVMEREGYRTDWLQEAYLKGEAGEARRALVRVLTKRGFKLTTKIEARIGAEKDLLRLERWLDAAITATSLAKVFTDA